MAAAFGIDEWSGDLTPEGDDTEEDHDLQLGYWRSRGWSPAY
ncbi:hypothetical protein [Streptomyces sp. NPDC048516]